MRFGLRGLGMKDTKMGMGESRGVAKRIKRGGQYPMPTTFQSLINIFLPVTPPPPPPAPLRRLLVCSHLVIRRNHMGTVGGNRSRKW